MIFLKNSSISWFELRPNSVHTLYLLMCLLSPSLFPTNFYLSIKFKTLLDVRFLFFSAEDWTQCFSHARQALCHWVTTQPALINCNSLSPLFPSMLFICWRNWVILSFPGNASVSWRCWTYVTFGAVICKPDDRARSWFCLDQFFPFSFSGKLTSQMMSLLLCHCTEGLVPIKRILAISPF